MRLVIEESWSIFSTVSSLIRIENVLYPSSPLSFLLKINFSFNIVQTMLDIAKKHDIPIVYEPETQEILSLFDAGDYVPEETWEVLAKVFAFVRGQLETISTNR